MAEKVRVLSIDGGGIRGVIPTMVLEKIEALTQRPISELFDLIAGTSTGSIIGMAMAAPGEDGRPRWSAHDYASFYMERGETIFPRSRKHLIRAAEGLLEEKYESTGVEQVAQELFGDRSVPVAGDVVECNGTFILGDGELEIEGSEPAADDGQATSAITGGTGAYRGAIGEVDIDFENYEFTLDLLIPED